MLGTPPEKETVGGDGQRDSDGGSFYQPPLPFDSQASPDYL